MTSGLALSRAGRAPSLLARAEPNLTSARSAHERFGMASRATSEPLQWLGSARCNPSLARSLAARRAYMCNIHLCVSAQSRLNCMLPSQHSQVYRIHELIESCNIQFTRLNDNWQHLYVTLYQETNSMVLPQKSLLRDLMPGFSLPAFSSGFFPQTG